MDQDTRQDIAAAAAAHRELGRDYDGAIAESLIERIGAEIDRRVDTRLGLPNRGSMPADTVLAGKRRAFWKGIAVGCAVTGIPAVLLAARGSQRDSRLFLVIVGLWAVLAVVSVIAKWARD